MDPEKKASGLRTRGLNRSLRPKLLITGLIQKVNRKGGRAQGATFWYDLGALEVA